MSRPLDWSPLAGTDPVPGDPYGLAASGRSLRDVADLLRSQAQALTEVAGSDGTGQVADRLRESATDLSGRLSAAVGRYEAAAAALGAYWPELDDAQAESAAALVQAQDAQARLEQAERSMAATAVAAAAPALEVDPAVVAAHDRAENSRATAHAAASGQGQAAAADLAAARRRLQRAVDARDRAADRARTAVRVACDDDLGDTWWDKGMEWVSENAALLRTIADVAGTIATAAGLLALAIGWIPVVGQLTAAILGAFATLAGLVSLLANTALALAGEKSWGAVALDVVGLLTAGVGRVAGAALKVTGKALQANGSAARAAASAATAARPELAGRIGAATASKLASGPLTPAMKKELAAAWGVSGQAVKQGAQAARTAGRESGLAQAGANLAQSTLKPKASEAPGGADRDGPRVDRTSRRRSGGRSRGCPAQSPRPVRGRAVPARRRSPTCCRCCPPPSAPC